MNLRTLALAALLCLPLASAGTATIQVPFGYIVEDTEGPTDLDLDEYTFHGKRFLVAESSIGGSVALYLVKGNDTMTVALDVPQAPIESTPVDLTPFQGLPEAVAALQAREFPVYDDADLRAYIAVEVAAGVAEHMAAMEQATFTATSPSGPLWATWFVMLIGFGGVAFLLTRNNQPRQPGQVAQVTQQPPRVETPVSEPAPATQVVHRQDPGDAFVS